VPELSDYQIVAKERFLSRQRYGLFDEQGAGKTPPAILAMAERVEPKKPFLVTAPAYLAHNWAREIELWLPSATVANSVTDDGVKKAEAFNSTTADFVLCSYHAWNTRKEPIKRRWSGYLFDEAHRLRSRTSKWTKKVFTTTNLDSKNRSNPYWFLTGTPVVRDAGDLWPFLYLCDRDVYRGYWNWVESMCHLSHTPWETIVGRVREPEVFVEVLQKYSLRRLLRDIPELADLTHTTKLVRVPLPSSVSRAIQQARTKYKFQHGDVSRDYTSAGAMIQDLLQLCSLPPVQDNPKFTAVFDYLRDERPGTRVVVYAWYTKTIDAFEERLRHSDLRRRYVGKISGGVRTSARNEAEDKYNATPDGILLGNVSAMKEGLNLQAGRDVVFIEESDLDQDNLQAIGRLKRRGQTEVVRVTKFITEGLEMKKHRLVQKGSRGVLHDLCEEYLWSEEISA
jgi:SNF2 family DNA or RNA helicase